MKIQFLLILSGKLDRTDERESNHRIHSCNKLYISVWIDVITGTGIIISQSFMLYKFKLFQAIRLPGPFFKIFFGGDLL